VRILPPLRHEDVAVKTTSFDSPPRGAARAAFQSPPVKAARGPLTTSPADKLIESSRVSVMNLTPSRRTNIVTLAPLSKGSHSVVFFSLKIQPPLVFKAVRHLAEGSLTTQHRNQYEQNLRIRGECQVADIVNDPRKEEVVAQVKIEGVPLSQFVGRFTPQHMSDLKEHLQVFISEYNRDCMLDLQPSNLIASDKGRIVLVDFNEGYEGFDGIHQLRTFFFRIYPEETSPNFDQAIELLTYFRSQSIKAYNDLMGLKECSPIAMAHFRIAMGY
jgi:hypothetical protein